MSEQLKQLQDLETQLHEVNQEFARASQTLYRTTDPNYEQREQIGDELREVQARWESITQQISQVLGIGSAQSASCQNTTKANPNENQ